MTIDCIWEDDDDDLRILDSIPNSLIKNKAKKNSSNFSQDFKLNKLLIGIEIVGFYMVTIPAITNLTYFMNQSFYLKNNKKYLDSHRVDLMVGQLLVTTKRAIQAAEVFRKM